MSKKTDLQSKDLEKKANAAVILANTPVDQRCSAEAVPLALKSVAVLAKEVDNMQQNIGNVLQDLNRIGNLHDLSQIADKLITKQENILLKVQQCVLKNTNKPFLQKHLQPGVSPILSDESQSSPSLSRFCTPIGKWTSKDLAQIRLRTEAQMSAGRSVLPVDPSQTPVNTTYTSDKNPRPRPGVPVIGTKLERMIELDDDDSEELVLGTLKESSALMVLDQNLPESPQRGRQKKPALSPESQMLQDELQRVKEITARCLGLSDTLTSTGSTPQAVNGGGVNWLWRPDSLSEFTKNLPESPQRGRQKKPALSPESQMLQDDLQRVKEITASCLGLSDTLTSTGSTPQAGNGGGVKTPDSLSEFTKKLLFRDNISVNSAKALQPNSSQYTDDASCVETSPDLKLSEQTLKLLRQYGLME